MHALLVDGYRGPAWVSDLLRSTGHASLYALAAALDPRSLRHDAAGSGHQYKWYEFNAGLRVPQRRLVRKAGRKVPAASFEVLHLVWRFLINPDLSARSDRRFRAAMPTRWRAALNRLLACEEDRLRIGPKLLELAGLRTMSFLDAVLLFAQARKTQSLARQGSPKALAIEAILLALPLLYAGDHIWTIRLHGQSEGNEDSPARLMHLLDHCLDLNTGAPGCPQFPVAERVQGVQWLQAQMEIWRQLHPRALKTRSAQLGFTASYFDWNASETVRFALSPFVPASAGPVDLQVPLGRPTDERAWSWAWRNFRDGTFSRRPTSRLVEDHWRERQTRSA